MPSARASASLSISACRTSPIVRKSLLAVVVGDLEDRALGLLDELARRAPRGRGPRPGSRRSPSAGGAAARARGRSARSWRRLPTRGDRAGRARRSRPAPPTSSSLPRERRCSVTREHVDRLARACSSVEHRLVDRARGARGRSPRARRRLLDDERVDACVSDSRIAPRTDCSASIECGGATPAGGRCARPIRVPAVAHRRRSSSEVRTVATDGSRQPRASPHARRLATQACPESSHVGGRARRRARCGCRDGGRPRGGLRQARTTARGARFCSTTIVLTVAVTPSATSTTTM